MFPPWVRKSGSENLDQEMKAMMTPRKKCRPGILLVLAAISLAAWGHAFGQQQAAPLTDQQVDQLRDTAGLPPERVKLYLGFIAERTNEIHRLSEAQKTGKSDAQQQDSRVHNLYEEFTRISDELEDNLDSFDQEHADMRKILKTVVEESEKWPAVLNEPKADSGDDFVRKTALAAVESVHDDAKQMLADQEKYFSQHKTAKN
jgi:hypothetical protein